MTTIGNKRVTELPRPLQKKEMPDRRKYIERINQLEVVRRFELKNRRPEEKQQEQQQQLQLGRQPQAQTVRDNDQDSMQKKSYPGYADPHNASQ